MLVREKSVYQIKNVWSDYYRKFTIFRDYLERKRYTNQYNLYLE